MSVGVALAEDLDRDVVVVLGIPVDNLTYPEVLARIERVIAEGRPRQMVTVNVDFVVQASADRELKRILTQADIVTADGMPVVWAARLLGAPLKERVTGADLVPMLARLSAEKGYRIFLLGGEDGVADQAADVLRRRFPGVRIVGTYEPPRASVAEMDHAGILARIQEARPDILLVAFGCPKQEKWIRLNLEAAGVPLAAGIGASLDYLVGKVRRAPPFFQAAGLEWVWRLLQEPRRLLRRYLWDLLYFSVMVGRQIGFFLLFRPRRLRPTGVQVDSKGPDVAVARLEGRIGLRDVKEVGARLSTVIGVTRHLVLDLSGLQEIDSSGFGLLLLVLKRVRNAGGMMALAGASPSVRRTLRIVNLHRHFVLYPDVETAREAVLRAAAARRDFRLDEVEPGVIAVGIEGELAEQAAEAFVGFVRGRLAGRDDLRLVTLDLAGVGFVDTRGIHALFRLRRALARSGIALSVAGVSKALQRVIRAAGGGGWIDGM